MSINWQGMYEQEKQKRLAAEEKCRQLMSVSFVQQDFAAKWRLSRVEFRVLRAFTKVDCISKAQLRAIFAPRGSGRLCAESTLWVRMGNLRDKLAKIKGKPIRILNVYGQGYRMPAASRRYLSKHLEQAK